MENQSIGSTKARGYLREFRLVGSTNFRLMESRRTADEISNAYAIADSSPAHP